MPSKDNPYKVFLTVTNRIFPRSPHEIGLSVGTACIVAHRHRQLNPVIVLDPDRSGDATAIPETDVTIRKGAEHQELHSCRNRIMGLQCVIVVNVAGDGIKGASGCYAPE